MCFSAYVYLPLVIARVLWNSFDGWLSVTFKLSRSHNTNSSSRNVKVSCWKKWQHMQGSTDRWIGPNFWRGCRDPRTDELVRIFKGECRDPRTAESVRSLKWGCRDPRTAELARILKGGVGIHGPLNWFEFFKVGCRDPRTAESVRIF